MRRRPRKPAATFRFEGASRWAQDAPVTLHKVEQPDDPEGLPVLVTRLVVGEPVTNEMINALNDLARSGGAPDTPPGGNPAVTPPDAPPRQNGDGGPRHARPKK